MKILKYLLLLIILVIAGACIMGAMQPSEFDVKRTKLVKAPANAVYDYVNEFKNWQEWGPWMEEDPGIKATYPEQTSGVGGSYSWTSEQGPGSIETIALEENKSIDQKIKFGEDMVNDVYWTFEEVDGGTNVTWGMKGTETPFFMKVIAAFNGGHDGMFGPMYEKGLENIDAKMPEYVKNNPPAPPAPPAPAYSLGGIAKINQATQEFIGYPLKSKVDHETMTKLFMEYMPKAGMHAAAQKLDKLDYSPGAVFTKWDEKTGESEFYIGLLIRKDVPLAEGMEKYTLPAGDNVMLAKYGPYGTGDAEAHQAIDAYLKDNGLEQNGPVWELYLNDPSEVKPEEIETEIHYPVK